MILGLVCARSGSVGIKDKNLRLVGGLPLYWRALSASLDCQQINLTALSTDIFPVPQVPVGVMRITRPGKLARQTTSKWEVWKHAVAEIEKLGDVKRVDAVVDIDATRPLKVPEDISLCVVTWLKDPQADSVMAITHARKNPYFDLLEYNLDGELHTSKSAGKIITCRQDTPDVFEHGGIYVVGRDALEADKDLFDGIVHGVEVPRERAHDIDDETDLEIAELLIAHATV